MAVASSIHSTCRSMQANSAQTCSRPSGTSVETRTVTMVDLCPSRQHQLGHIEVPAAKASLTVRQVEVPHSAERPVETQLINQVGAGVELVPPAPERRGVALAEMQ